jgi:hypothetical protein
MIFHASIPGRDPERVARVLAELWQGESFRFPPWPGAWVAMAGDARGTLVEVYPHTQTMMPGSGEDDMVQPRTEAAPAVYSCFHMAIATGLSPRQVLAIGAREGWRAVPCSRGGAFDVIELWIENTLMLEVLTPVMQRDYLASINYDTFRPVREALPAEA